MNYAKSRFVRSCLLIFFCLILAACNSNSSGKKAASELFYEPLFAKGFYIEKEGDDKLLHVFNPWQGAEGKEFIYRLYPRTAKEQHTNMLEIPVPVERVVCLSTTHIAYIDCLQKTASIVGISGAGYVSNDTILKRYQQNLVRDVGYETSLSYELIVSMQPDVVFAYGVNGEITSVVKRLNELGIRVVYLADYLEEHPLGRLEYLMAMAAFYNCEEEAFERFDTITADYLDLCEVVQQQAVDTPKVLLNAPLGDVWYFPGEHNYMNVLLHDAQARSVLEPKGERSSKALNLEAAYIYALQAGYWLHPNMARTWKELKMIDARFSDIPSSKNKKVYNNTRRRTVGGGSDFWESGVVNPHIILRDLVKIFHPEILPGHELVYYEQLH